MWATCPEVTYAMTIWENLKKIVFLFPPFNRQKSCARRLELGHPGHRLSILGPFSGSGLIIGPTSAIREETSQ